MRNGDGPPAIRVLPADGGDAMASRSPDPRDGERRRWLVPIVVVGFALLAFVAATRPESQPEPAAASTTIPPGLSAVSPELIDLTSTGSAATEAWESVPFEWPGRINDLLRHNTSLFAIGHDDEGAAAWVTGTGSAWREVSQFEHPENPDSSIDHAVVWNGGIVALGAVADDVGLWTAPNRRQWTYHGPVADMGGHTLIGLAATDTLLAVAAMEGTHTIWSSQDGLEWSRYPAGAAFDQILVNSLTGVGDWFYAAGQERNSEQAAIYRSRDGVDWEETSGLGDDLLPASWGTVVDITATADGLLAVGEANDGIAVWRSSDGAAWSRIASADAALRGHSVAIELKGTRNAEEALVAIDGQEHRVVEGSQVLTNVGLIEVVGISDSSAVVEWADGSSDRLDIDSQPHTVRLRQSPISAVAQGRRIAIAGWAGVHSPQTPAVWTSVDGGDSWRIDYPDPALQGWARAASVSGANITVVGGSDRETPQAWHSTWDTSELEAAGVELAMAYFDAVERQNTNAVVALLPEQPARFQIPSLGRADLPWWDEATEAIDPDSVAATFDYLRAINTRIDLGECRTRMRLGEVDSLRVSCDFDVASDLLATYSNEDHAGTAEIVVEDGAIKQVLLSTAPSAHMWQMLIDGVGFADSSTQALMDDPATATIDPVFTPESAPVHLRVTEEFIAGLLRPGDTRIIETRLGTMEWSWLEPAPVPVAHLNWITHYRDGFIAVGHGEPQRWTDEVSLWTSQDGLTWQRMSGQPDFDGLWNLQPLRDGLIGQAWERERSFLTFYDGDEWTAIDLPGSEEAGRFYDVGHLATSGETALVVTFEWSEDSMGSPEFRQAWLIGPDNVPRRTTLPAAPFSADADIMGLEGSDEGFLLGTIQGWPPSLRIWLSPDGYDWDEVAATTVIEETGYIWNLQRHKGRYFAVGEGTHTDCSTGPCEQLWSSPDGGEWERVVTTSGEPVGAYDLGSGPLGLMAIAVDFYSDRPPPRPLYLSPDGTTWERAGNLALWHPDAEWWWASPPAVGTDTILVPGSAFRPNTGFDEDTPFLIVGRLLDD